MNILLINWQDIKNPLAGGAEVYLHQIFKRIAAKGHKVTLLCSGYKGADREEELDGIIIKRRGERFFFNYIVPIEARKLIAKNNFDIVIDDINKIPFYTPLYIKQPLLGMVMHLFDKSIFLEASLPIAAYVHYAEKLALSVYKNIPLVAISESTKKELLVHGHKEENVKIVPCAVNHSTYYRLEKIDKQNLVIGYVGRIKKYKSVDHLLKAFAIILKEVPQAKLLIIGDGDYQKELIKLSQTLNIQHATTFTGFLNTEDKLKMINQMRVVVNTSSKEGWGLTITEANACGVPAVASDVPGLHDAVIDNETGLLYEYGNIEQLAEKILLLVRDNNLHSRLSNAALEYAKFLTWDRSADIMMNVISDVVKNNLR